MINSFLRYIGQGTINKFQSFYEALAFSLLCFWRIPNPKNYNSATTMVLVKQIYFTAIQIIPIFTFIGIVVGSALIASVVVFAIDFGIKDKIGIILAHLIMNEFAPFFTILLITLRSSAAIVTEISVMKVSNELQTLESFNIDIINYLFLPRIISGIVSTVMLSFMLSLLMFFSGYFFLSIFLQMGFEIYLETLIKALSLSNFLVLVIKSAFFGFFATMIPIYSGLKTSMAYNAIPISVLQGMFKLFLALIFVEVIALILQFI